MATLYLHFHFMVWSILGSLSTEIAESLHAVSGFMMSPSQKATLLSIPILAGALLRVVLGFGIDTFGPKKTLLLAQSVVIFVLFYTFFRGEYISYNELLVIALGLGFAGASFFKLLPQATQWYPPKLQGVTLNFIFAPKIAELWGWQALFLASGILSTFIFVSTLFVVKNTPLFTSTIFLGKFLNSNRVFKKPFIKIEPSSP
jgi:NNP family nitrate/nitrite transporter-like MFS transporter